MSSLLTRASSTPSSGCGETPSGSRSRTSRPDPRPCQGLLDGLIAVLLAPSCVSCAALLAEPSRGPVCAACWQAVQAFVPPACARCGDPLPSWRIISAAAGLCPRCRRGASAVSHSRAIGPYDGTLRSIVHALKYRGCRSIAGRLGARMREAGADILDSASVAVPVPLHRRRRLTRGFNQASDLARGLGLPVVEALRRTRSTRSQTDLHAASRHANVRGAFALRRRTDVRGLRVVIVDDVSTTGATLDACARTLLEAGAREVSALTAARVVATRRG